MKKYFTFLSAFMLFSISLFSQGVIIPTSTTQADFLKTYKLALSLSDNDYRFSGNGSDSLLFPYYGEYSLYWVKSGSEKGSFVSPQQNPTGFSTVTNSTYSNYNWQSAQHYALQFRKDRESVAIFQSSILQNNTSVNWEALYFKKTFDSYLYSDMYYFINENQLSTSFFPEKTQLLIIPSFSVRNNDARFYIDSVFTSCPMMKTRIDTFLAHGGTIYAEGNAVYFIEKLGYLTAGAVNFNNVTYPSQSTNIISINYTNSDQPVAFTQSAAGNELYSFGVPAVNIGSGELVASLAQNNNPAVFVLKGASANRGRIICNLGLPAVGGNTELLHGSRQLQWSLNAILSAFAKSVDVSRSVYNDLSIQLTAGVNTVAYDRVDTFEVRLLVRNLSSTNISGINLKEQINDYFDFSEMITSGLTFTINGHDLLISGLDMPAMSEKVITYKVVTPPLNSTEHDNVDHYLWWQTYLPVSYNTTSYADAGGISVYGRSHNFADIMFSADIVADADLNWKNFLGLYYQPFKVFMIMENKERTAAVNTKYVQYIPKDVPFYGVDHTLNIPILQTPGGDYIDVLKGSNDESHPDFDMDHDGHPDAWLDTASIYPKGYTLEEESVYWQNPWHRLSTGDTIPYYEDINHNGIRAHDDNSDGIFEVEDPGDKIRVWKVTWDIGTVAGYQAYDPYCSYEIWVDPPDLVGLSAGVGHAYGRVNDSIPGMFYPYTPSVHQANLADTTWTYWMDRDNQGQVMWKQLIYQQLNNYEGYTFIDTAAQHYTLLPSDICAGTVPQPRNEFIAVLSMGGEEIDMEHPVPHRSNYSNIDYKTIFNESKKTPIRTTYTYYAPLPNPLQFEYLTNNFTIKDTIGNLLRELPNKGKALISYEIDASTEYSYYWIRNVGYDVKYNDPSLAIDGVDSFGDGVFGYFIYNIPKGLGGYSITLPKTQTNKFNIDSIIRIDGQPYHKWIDNPNTRDSVRILENDFWYSILIPQILIPPALDDDNGDGIDDWIDDRGDRFHSPTGYLHDWYMQGNGEDYPIGTANVYPHTDEGMAGYVDAGWSSGSDNTYGDDEFETLGKTHITIKADYHGEGREGPLPISKGGWLVVEEIFGGSPWVIFSHTLSAMASGVDLKLESSPNPSVVKYGIDTTYLKHKIYDTNEPHEFNSFFDPYYVSYGYGESSITTYAGGKDPCSLMEPEILMPAIIDPSYGHTSLTLIPLADHTNPDMVNYPRTVTGTFLEAVITVVNGTDDNWINTTVKPVIPPQLGNTHVLMSYVSYPRPLVPAVADPVTGQVLHTGDQIGSFLTGWRFNQPVGEVLTKLGDTLNLMQPTRRAYFIILFSIDETLPNGIYDIPFTISGKKYNYSGTYHGTLNYEVPSLKFSITDRNANDSVATYQKLVIGKAALTDLNIFEKPVLTGLKNTKWSQDDVNYTDFTSMTNTLPTINDTIAHIETIDMSRFNAFPSVDTSQLFLLEQARVNSYGSPTELYITNKQDLNYTYQNRAYTLSSDSLKVSPFGPLLKVEKKIYSINGHKVYDQDTIIVEPGKKLDLVVQVLSYNLGNDAALNTTISIQQGGLFVPVPDSLPSFCIYAQPVITAATGTYTPGEMKEFFIHYTLKDNVCDSVFSAAKIIKRMDIRYTGQMTAEVYICPDTLVLIYPALDFRLISLSANKSILGPGDVVTLTIRACNGDIAADNVDVKVTATTNRDTLTLETKHYDHLSGHEAISFTCSYTVPSGITYANFKAMVDPANKYCEICENNNTRSLTIRSTEADWFARVNTYPNPFGDEVSIEYELGKDLDGIKLLITDVKGKRIEEYNDLLSNAGLHTFIWNASKVRSGTYYLRFSGNDLQGYSHEFLVKVVKTIPR